MACSMLVAQSEGAPLFSTSKGAERAGNGFAVPYSIVHVSSLHCSMLVALICFCLLELSSQ